MKRSWLGVAAMGVSTALLASGCGFTGIYDTPLPGGADIGDHPKTLHVHMSNVYDLVPQAAVKVDDVPVGRVDKIAVGTDPAGTWFADVTVVVNGDVALPADTTASLKQTSLLGEKYLNLNTRNDSGTDSGTAPNRTATLANNATVRESDRSQHVEAEELFGALSLLLNNGGLEQVRTIARELNQVTDGNEGNLRTLLRNARTFSADLDANSDDITKAIDGLDRLSATLNGQKDKLADTVDNIGPGLRTLRDQRADLVRMLRALDNLSSVATDVVNRSKDDLVADLKLLRPSVQKLADAGRDLPDSLELLASFPFTDSALQGVKGDYVNLFFKLDLNLQSILDNLTRSRLLFPGPNPVTDLLNGGLRNNTGGSSPGGGGGTGGTGLPDLATPPQSGGSAGGSDGQSGGLHGLLGSLLGGA